MKIFLVSPDERNILFNAGDRFPLGLLYISAALTQNGISNEVFDFNYSDLKNFMKRVEKENPDYVGLSVISSPCLNQMKRIGNMIKKISPNTRIIAGGAHVSVMPESLEGLATSTIMGYGEEAVLDALRGKEGIIKKHADINKFPIPDRDKVSQNDYSMFFNGLRMATIVTSRGCPFDCVFCANHERVVQFREPSNIREELKELKTRGYGAVYILDENFVVKKSHFETVVELMKEENMKYKVEMRTNDVTREIAEKMKETGCINVALGIESGNNEILRRANKRTSVEINQQAIEHFYRAGIPVKGFFIIGLPGETYETVRETINFAEKMRNRGLSEADFYALTPFPGSRIWNNPEKYGIKILSKDFDSYLQKDSPVIETENLSNEEIKILLDESREKWKK